MRVSESSWPNDCERYGNGQTFKVEGVHRIIERPRVLAFTWLPSWDEEATETLVRFDLHEQNGVRRFA